MWFDVSRQEFGWLLMRKAVLIWCLYTEIPKGTHISDDFKEGECLLVASTSYCFDCCAHCTCAAYSCATVDQNYFFVVNCFDGFLDQLAEDFTVLFSIWNAAIRPNSILDNIYLTWKCSTNLSPSGPLITISLLMRYYLIAYSFPQRIVSFCS